MIRTVLLLALAASITTGCGALDDADRDVADILAARKARLDRTLKQADDVRSDAPVARWILPESLREISGLVLTHDDRLFVHGDEIATIYEIDYRRGVVIKEFSLGAPAVRGDFEAITMVSDTFLLLTSDGMLYRFLEGEPSATVRYTRMDTGLGDRCEFEGITYDPAANALVLACKHPREKDLEDLMVLFRWPLAPDSAANARAGVPLTVPFAELVGTRGWKQFEPSDITVNPATGNYVIVASLQRGLVEVTPAGEVIRSRSLPPGHPQAEGVAVTHDGLLLVSDEATTEPAVLTAYRWQP